MEDFYGQREGDPGANIRYYFWLFKGIIFMLLKYQYDWNKISMWFKFKQFFLKNYYWLSIIVKGLFPIYDYVFYHQIS